MLVAEKEGVFQPISRNRNEYGLFSHNSCEASDLAFADFFVRLRLFAWVFGFCQRHDTRNDTRGNVLREDLRGRCTPAALRIRRRAGADLRFKREGASGTLNGKRKYDEDCFDENRYP